MPSRTQILAAKAGVLGYPGAGLARTLISTGLSRGMRTALQLTILDFLRDAEVGDLNAAFVVH